ncbi:hypothetical protein AAHE18_03G182600 [Arachis hypogaea]
MNIEQTTSKFQNQSIQTISQVQKIHNSIHKIISQNQSIQNVKTRVHNDKIMSQNQSSHNQISQNQNSQNQFTKSIHISSQNQFIIIFHHSFMTSSEFSQFTELISLYQFITVSKTQNFIKILCS